MLRDAPFQMVRHARIEHRRRARQNVDVIDRHAREYATSLATERPGGVFPSEVRRRRTQSRNPSSLAVSFRAESRNPSSLAVSFRAESRNPSWLAVSFRAESTAGGHSRGTPLRLRCLSERSPPQADTVEEPLLACGVFPSGGPTESARSRGIPPFDCILGSTGFSLCSPDFSSSSGSRVRGC